MGLEAAIYNETLNETLYINELPSGIKCYIIPKKNFSSKHAMLVVRYGSVDNDFSVDGRVSSVPDGVAHFLEHKLFEDAETNVFDKFLSQGANVNAYTNLTSTAYYFSCTDNFSANYRLLLNFVQSPYFTYENVEKEKGIIASEINMYRDNPEWRSYFNLQAAMYHSSPVRKDIAGSVESISGITKDMLYECYETFYFPRNMAVVCVGDFDRERVYELTDSLVAKKPKKDIVRLYGSEPITVKNSRIEDKMPVSMPLFSIGYKDGAHGDIIDRLVTTRLLTDIIAGQSGSLYARLYDEGLIDDSFSMEYVGGSFYGQSVFAGVSKSPERVCELLSRELEAMAQSGIDSERFDTIRKKHIGHFVRGFNAIEQIAPGQADMYTKDIDIFDYLNGLENATITRAEERMCEHFREENRAVSIVAAQ